MPYAITRYHCSVCRTPYAKHAEALRCERQSHHARSVWPSRAAIAKAEASTPSDVLSCLEVGS